MANRTTVLYSGAATNTTGPTQQIALLRDQLGVFAVEEGGTVVATTFTATLEGRPDGGTEFAKIAELTEASSTGSYKASATSVSCLPEMRVVISNVTGGTAPTLRVTLTQ